MHKVPLQIDMGRLAGLPQENLFSVLAGALGDFACWATETGPDVWIDLLARADTDANHELSEPQATVWLQAVARELLLMATTNPGWLSSHQDNLPESVLNASPFGGTKPNSLREWISARFQCAAAIFPLSNENAGGTPGIGQAWVFRRRDKSGVSPGSQAVRAEDATRLLRDIAGEDCDAFLLVDGQDRVFTGNSWQLAAGLAGRALQSEGETILHLAQSVIASGVIEREEVKRIELANKLELTTDRLWLLPYDNLADIPPRVSRRLKMKGVPKLEASWRIVNGTGFVEKGDSTWSAEGAYAFHTFTSKAYQPIIAAVLLARPKSEIVLWDSGSEESQEVCDQLKDLLPLLYPECPRIRVEKVSSSNLAEAERQLREVFDTYGASEAIVFNITNGNLLMRLAVGNLGMFFPGVRFVYRDIDNQGLDFTCVQYDGHQPTTAILRVTEDFSYHHWLQRLFFIPRVVPVRSWQTVLAESLVKPSGSREGFPESKDEAKKSAALVEEALKAACRAHGNDLRKGTSIPYFTHPLQVALILADHDFPPDVIVAGLLHDTVEDTSVTLEQVKDEFGEKIAEIVADCGEADKSLPWNERKEHTIASIPNLAEEALAVMSADKLHNIRCIAKDYRKLGEDLWDRFNHGREEQGWYYRSVARELARREGPHGDLAEQLGREVEAFFGREDGLLGKNSASSPEKSSGQPFS